MRSAVGDDGNPLRRPRMGRYDPKWFGLVVRHAIAGMTRIVVLGVAVFGIILSDRVSSPPGAAVVPTL